MRNARTDLAIEAGQITDGKAAAGIEIIREDENDIKITSVRVLNEEGRKRVGKKQGTYITLEVGTTEYLTDEALKMAAKAVGRKLEQLLSEAGVEDNILVVGLGNRNITPDAVGPLTVKKLQVTRHLFEYLPKYVKKGVKSVSAVAPDVLGNTGIETLEIIKGIAEKTKPSAIIAVDALAAGSVSRVGNTVQLSDTGIHPGSGVGNSRKELSRDTLGIPVIAIGVPTVTEAAAISEEEEEEITKMMVTPKEIDSIIEKVATILSEGISHGLHKTDM